MEVAMSTHPYILLARDSVGHFLNHHTKLPCPDPLSGDLLTRSGAFVSIKKKRQLRGCIGTLEPSEPIQPRSWVNPRERISRKGM